MHHSRSIAALLTGALLTACTADFHEATPMQPERGAHRADVPQNFEPAFLLRVPPATGKVGSPQYDAFFALSDGSYGLFADGGSGQVYLHVSREGRVLHRVELARAFGRDRVDRVWRDGFRRGDRVLVDFRGGAGMFDMLTGAPAWQREVEGGLLGRGGALFAYATPCPGDQTLSSIDVDTGEERPLLSWPFVEGHPRVVVEEVAWLPGVGSRDAESVAGRQLYLTLSGSKDTLVDGETRVLSYVTSALYDDHGDGAALGTPTREWRRVTAEGRYSADFGTFYDDGGPRRYLVADGEIWAEDARTGEEFWRKPLSALPDGERPRGAQPTTEASSVFYPVSSYVTGDARGTCLGYVLDLASGEARRVSDLTRRVSAHDIRLVGGDHLVSSGPDGGTSVYGDLAGTLVAELPPLFDERYPPSTRAHYDAAADRLVVYSGEHLYAVDDLTGR